MHYKQDMHVYSTLKCYTATLSTTYLADVPSDLCQNMLCLHMQISDFGMSRDLAQEDYYISHGGKVPVKWTAPEVCMYIYVRAHVYLFMYGHWVCICIPSLIRRGCSLQEETLDV